MLIQTQTTLFSLSGRKSGSNGALFQLHLKSGSRPIDSESLSAKLSCNFPVCWRTELLDVMDKV